MSIATRPKRRQWVPMRGPILPWTGRFQWTRQRVAIAVAVPILLVWLAPMIAARTSLAPSILGSVMGVQGTVTVRGVSLGWFSPVALEGIEVRDAQGQPLAEVARAQSERWLLGLISSSSRLGNFWVQQPKLHVVLRPNGNNLQDALPSRTSTGSGSGKPAVRPQIGLVISDGTIVIDDAATGQAWQVDKIELAASLPADPAQPLELKAAGEIADARQRGRFEAETKTHRPGAGTSRVGAAAEITPDEIAVKLDSIPLSALEPLVRRWSPGTRLAGRLSASLECRWDLVREQRAVVQGTIVADDFCMASPALGKDQPALSRLRADLQAAYHDGCIEFDRMAVESDAGSVSLQGLLDLNAPATGTILAALIRQNYDIQAKFDVARLAAILPETLHIQRGTQITSGQVQLGLSGRSGRDGMTWQGRLETSNLTGVNAGKQLVWQQPVQITLSMKDSQQGPVVESLRCDSDFVKLNATGHREEWNLSASFDLNRLVSQSAGFLDLGGLRLAGDGWLRATGRRSPQRDFKTAADFEVRQFEMAIPGRPAWAEPQLSGGISITGWTDYDQKHRIDTLIANLQSGSEQFSARLMEPVADFHRGGVSTWEVHAQGELAHWAARLGAWNILPGWKLAGAYDFLSAVAISTEGLQLRQTRASVVNLVMEGPSTTLREPKVNMVLTGSYRPTGRRLELEEATLESNVLSTEARQFVCAIPADGPVTMSGTIRFNGMLNQLMAAYQSPAAKAAWQINGRLTGTVDLQQNGNVVSARAQAGITDLVAVHSSGQRFQEPQINLAARATYSNTNRLLQLEQAEVASGTLAVHAGGTVTSVGTASDLQITGKVDYDTDKIGQLLRARYGEGIRLSGQTSGAMACRGAWGTGQAVTSATFGWNWGDIHGFQVGRGELQLNLSRGVLDVPPTTLDVSEGRVLLAPRIRFSPAPAELTLPPGRFAEQIRINPVMCSYGLKYVAPILAGITSAEGRFSIELEGCRIPLTDPSKGEIAGKLTIHTIQIGPGPLLGELASVLGKAGSAQLRREAVVPFRMVDGRIYHRDLELIFPDVTVRTYGSVGMDQSLAIMAEMPVPKNLQNDKVLGPILKGQVLRLPIGGTLHQPKIDRKALDQLMQQSVKNAVQNPLKGLFKTK